MSSPHPPDPHPRPRAPARPDAGRGGESAMTVVGLISGTFRTLITAKWSIRADREEQFMSDFQTYERLESMGEDFAYVLVTNEFDAARLRAACERRRQNAPLFTHVVHLNPAAVDVVYREAQSEGAVAVREHIAKGRLISLGTWLVQLRQNRAKRGGER